MADWKTEVAELHAVFESYFLGTVDDDLSRVDAALAPTFTIVSPSGTETSRDQVLAALKAGYNHTASLAITTTDYQLLDETDELVIAAYTESHALAEASNHRRSTVVFRRQATAPNGLQWLRVHETWIHGEVP